MADTTAYKIRDAEVPLRVAAPSWVEASVGFFTSMLATTTDGVVFFALPKGVRIMNAYIEQGGTLGTVPRATLALGTGTALAGATTAGTASAKWMQDAGIAPITLDTATNVKVTLSDNAVAAAAVRVGVLIESYRHGDAP